MNTTEKYESRFRALQLEHQLERLHRRWADLSGIAFPQWSPDLACKWKYLFEQCGKLGMPMEEALRIVIEEIKFRAKALPVFRTHLAFNKITDVSRFTEHLGNALARRPAPKPVIVKRSYAGTERASIEVKQPDVKPIGDVLSSPAFQEFVNLKDPKAFEEFVNKNKGDS